MYGRKSRSSQSSYTREHYLNERKGKYVNLVQNIAKSQSPTTRFGPGYAESILRGEAQGLAGSTFDNSPFDCRCLFPISAGTGGGQLQLFYRPARGIACKVTRARKASIDKN